MCLLKVLLVVCTGVVSLIPGGAHRETQCPWSTQRTLWPKTPGEVFVPEVSTTPTGTNSEFKSAAVSTCIWNNSTALFIALEGWLHCLVLGFQVHFVKLELHSCTFETSCMLMRQEISSSLGFSPCCFPALPVPWHWHMTWGFTTLPQGSELGHSLVSPSLTRKCEIKFKD